jgi:hypothetical protein
MSHATRQADALPAGYGLVTEDQLHVEALAMRIMALPAVQAALAQVEAAFRDDPVIDTFGAASNVADAARELVHQTVTYVITEDPARPRLLWTYTAPRRGADGGEILGSRFIESTDSIYRVVTAGAGYSYVIGGRRPHDSAAYITFEVWNAAQGLAPGVRYVAHLSQTDMIFEQDGAFAVTIGPEPADGRANHLHLPEGGWVIIRESLSDWMTQSVLEDLSVRLDGEVDRPAPALADLERRVLEVMPMAVQVNRTYMHRMFEERNSENLYIAFGNSLNHLGPAVTTRGGAWGYVTGTLYQLEDGQALMVTIDTDDARYFAVQLHDAWGRTLDPMFMTSRNNAASAPNPDGSVTYVIAARDTGVANWLDTRGLGSGSVILRWQGITTTDDPAPGLILDSRLVALEDLRAALPEGVPMMSGEGRERELFDRRIACERRARPGR